MRFFHFLHTRRNLCTIAGSTAHKIFRNTPSPRSCSSIPGKCQFGHGCQGRQYGKGFSLLSKLNQSYLLFRSRMWIPEWVYLCCHSQESYPAESNSCWSFVHFPSSRSRCWCFSILEVDDKYLHWWSKPHIWQMLWNNVGEHFSNLWSLTGVRKVLGSNCSWTLVLLWWNFLGSMDLKLWVHHVGVVCNSSL